MALPQGLFLPPRTTTLYVAAANASDRARAQADFLCTGVNDHLTIQAALDALPAAGGMVFLSEGTFNCEASINLDSNQTLRGCGRNTILTTTTANLDIITATGGAGTEKVGILIADLCVDGNTGGDDVGILLTYVDYSKIRNVWSLNNNEFGIQLDHSDFNEIIGNTCQESTVYHGIYLNASNGNTITGNTCQGNEDAGIYLDTSNDNTITGNTCQGNGIYGIALGASNGNTITGNTCQGNTTYGIVIDTSNGNTITGNTCQGNTTYGIVLGASNGNTITGNTCQGNERGIYLGVSNNNTITGNTCQGNGISGIILSASNNNTITGNTLTENSQKTTNTYDDIYLEDSDYNNIQGNTCRAGALANKPRYGINISNAGCGKNIVVGNDIYDDGFGTGAFNDAGTLTHVEDDNRGIQLDQIRHYRRVKNTSGAQRVAGDVVSLKAVANGYEVTAPAAVGERQVFGMVAETINNNDWGLVQVKGKTTALKATNAGGGNIVIGDNLITENGVRARKAAAATDPIFARALEACAAANCTIDAYIKSPWD